MKLDKLYYSVLNLINKVNFESLWKGFKPLKFALYNDKECFCDGEFIEKTDAFLGNTSILYNGEMIAIWNVMEEINPVILCSKMVHEMFHGFQQLNKESRFPNEFDSIYNYNYYLENLNIKLQENHLIFDLVNEFNCEKFRELLSLRKYRYNNFKYEFLYESMIEQIEGSANYIELNVLKQLSLADYNLKLENMKNDIIQPNNLFPIRIISYDIGALLLHVLKDNNISFNEDFNDKTFLFELVLSSSDIEFTSLYNVSNELSEFVDRSKEIVEFALKKNEVVFDGEEILLGFNVYNARYYNGYIISRYFVMIGKENNPNILYGDFVIETQKVNVVSKIYKI